MNDSIIKFFTNENVLKRVDTLFGRSFPCFGNYKEAVDVYIKGIKDSNLSSEVKAVMILNAKPTLKKLKNQGDIVKIALENAKKGTDFSEKSKVDEEWFDRFMDAAGHVSLEKMQGIWGKILAKEFEEPGTTPKSIVRILTEISSECAEAFSKIANMKVNIAVLDENNKVILCGKDIFIPYRYNESYMDGLGLNFRMLNELESLGLIKFDYVNGDSCGDMRLVSKNIIIWEKEKKLFNKNKRTEVPMGNVTLTQAGNALSNITQPKDNDGNYIEAVKIYLNQKGYNFDYTSDYDFLEDV